MTSPRKSYRSRMPEYRSWYSMKQRCSYKHETHYEYYGGRGITVCERWAIFENFLEDMGKKDPLEGRLTESTMTGITNQVIAAGLPKHNNYGI